MCGIFCEFRYHCRMHDIWTDDGDRPKRALFAQQIHQGIADISSEGLDVDAGSKGDLDNKSGTVVATK